MEELIEFLTLSGEQGIEPEDLMNALRSWDDWQRLSNILKKIVETSNAYTV